MFKTAYIMHLATVAVLHSAAALSLDGDISADNAQVLWPTLAAVAGVPQHCTSVHLLLVSGLSGPLVPLIQLWGAIWDLVRDYKARAPTLALP